MKVRLWSHLIVMPMDEHPERAFFQKSQTFGLGQTKWAKNCRGILGIFGQTTVPILVLWVSCPWLGVYLFVFYKKRPKTYNSQIFPKYDIGRKSHNENNIKTKITDLWSWGCPRDSRWMSYEDSKIWVSLSKYLPQILMVFMYIGRKLILQTKIL